MSHTTTLKSIVIRDVAAIEAAVAELKAKGVDIDLVRDVAPRMYYPDQLRKDTGKATADYVLRLNGGQYDVALVKQEDGTFAPVFDTWAGHVSRQLGAACPLPGTEEGRIQHAIGRFAQEYARFAATNAAVAQGYMIESSFIDDKGNYQLNVLVA